MRQPKAPPAARVMAANALLDRGWGKAAQTVAVDGEIRQLVEVKLNVVQARPASHVLPGAALATLEPNDIKELSSESCCPPTVDWRRSSRATLSNSNHGARSDSLWK